MKSYINKEEEEEEIICDNCDSELLLSLRKCPICGNDLSLNSSLDQTEKALRRKFTIVYNMVFWAETFEIDTLNCNKMISQAREELEVGDLDTSEELIDQAFEEIFDPLVKELETIDKNKSVFKEDISEEKISEIKDLLIKSIGYMKDGDLDSSLLTLKEYKKKIETNKSV
ncbi:MAG: hypothetical protein ACQEQM_08870 [Thermoplasmatota archaeon]